MKTYEDYKSETCDICKNDSVTTHISEIALCAICENEIFAHGGGAYKECHCDLYCDRDHKDWKSFDEDKAGIPALYQDLLQRSIGRVTPLPKGYFGLWEELVEREVPVERKIPALAGKSYSIRYHENSEGITICLESMRSPSKVECEFPLFYNHGFDQSCEYVQEQIEKKWY